MITDGTRVLTWHLRQSERAGMSSWPASSITPPGTAMASVSPAFHWNDTANQSAQSLLGPIFCRRRVSISRPPRRNSFHSLVPIGNDQ